MQFLACFAHKSASKTVTALARAVGEIFPRAENNDAGESQAHKQPNAAAQNVSDENLHI